jgi:hypothetical protein
MNIEDLENALKRLMNKNTEFDQFTPFIPLVPGPFTFHSTRYELWKHGQKISQGSTPTKVEALLSPVSDSDINRYYVQINNPELHNTVVENNVFLIFTTQKDRIMLLNLPRNASRDTQGLSNLRSFLPSTGIGSDLPSSYWPVSLDKNQPYCCSLFYQTKKLVKITFSINEPETLLELYSV